MHKNRAHQIWWTEAQPYLFDVPKETLLAFAEGQTCLHDTQEQLIFVWTNLLRISILFLDWHFCLEIDNWKIWSI